MKSAQQTRNVLRMLLPKDQGSDATHGQQPLSDVDEDGGELDMYSLRRRQILPKQLVHHRGKAKAEDWLLKLMNSCGIKWGAPLRRVLQLGQ